MLWSAADKYSEYSLTREEFSNFRKKLDCFPDAYKHFPIFVKEIQMRKTSRWIFYKALRKHFDGTAFIIPRLQKRRKTSIQVEAIPMAGWNISAV